MSPLFLTIPPHSKVVEEKNTNMLKRIEIYKNFYSKAKSEIKILSGEAEPEVYNSDDLVKVLIDFIAFKNGKLKVVFSDEAKTVKSACSIFSNEHEKLIDAYKKLSISSGGRENLEMYWTTKRPYLHYVVLDSLHVLIEEAGHKSNQEFRDLKIIYNNNDVGNFFEREFDSYIELIKNNKCEIR